MGEFLFLFPIEEYFRDYVKVNRDLHLPGHPTEMVRMIDARYRDRGYGINWLLFSQENDALKPDLSQVPDYIKFQKQDGVLAAGISFSKCCSEKIYPDFDYILDQLPPHKRLVLGGFHQWSCVDRAARRSYERGADTFVDEDLTQLFFDSRRIQEIPLIRKEWTLKELGAIDEVLYKLSVLKRKDKPWFIQR